MDPNNVEAKLGMQHATQYLELMDLYRQARDVMGQNSFDAATIKLQTIIKRDFWSKDAKLDQYRRVQTFAQCDQTEVSGKIQQVLSLLRPSTGTLTAKP